MWYQTVTSQLTGKQLVNDSKTPSGQVHVGSLRGVLIHDALYRSLLRQGNTEARYIYGIDDYDPMDGLPADAGNDLRQYMGMPLCHIPAPAGSSASDLADHYTSQFLDVLKELGVGAAIYRTRDLYRDGTFNKAIETILDNAALVRQIYKDVSGSEKPDDWYPFQVICTSCGKIGTTQVTDYSDGQVHYRCQPNLVQWAQGCGHVGQTSPLNGSGKLAWKLEWVAKWATLGITIEGSGKDHCTKGGSHDVAVRCIQRIFKQKPPINVPYEFFLVSGTKMSSSKGIGTSARDMSNFLPPAVLRFLMIRTPPKRTVNFSTSHEYIVKLFNEYDQLLAKDSQESIDMQAMVQPTTEVLWQQPVGFQLISALLQLPHQDITNTLLKRYDINQQQQQDLALRIAAASYWLEHFATEEDRVVLQEQLPESAQALTASQKAVLFVLGYSLLHDNSSDDDYQQLIFDCSRLIPIESKQAFAALYTLLLDKQQGPKGGSLLAYLDRQFLEQRLTCLDPNVEQLLQHTAMTAEELDNWLTKHQEMVETVHITDITSEHSVILQLTLTLTNGRVHILRTADMNQVCDRLAALHIKISARDTLSLDSWRVNWQQLIGRN